MFSLLRLLTILFLFLSSAVRIIAQDAAVVDPPSQGSKSKAANATDKSPLGHAAWTPGRTDHSGPGVGMLYQRRGSLQL